MNISSTKLAMPARNTVIAQAPKQGQAKPVAPRESFSYSDESSSSVNVGIKTIAGAAIGTAAGLAVGSANNLLTFLPGIAIGAVGGAAAGVGVSFGLSQLDSDPSMGGAYLVGGVLVGGVAGIAASALLGLGDASTLTKVGMAALGGIGAAGVGFIADNA